MVAIVNLMSVSIVGSDLWTSIGWPVSYGIECYANRHYAGVWMTQIGMPTNYCDYLIGCKNMNGDIKE